MDRPLKFLVALAIVAAPLPAAAQAWSATVVSGAPNMPAQKRMPLTLDRDAYPHRPGSLPPTQPGLAARPALKLTPTHELGDIPDVSVQAKDEWSDDQGLRVGPTKLAYKRRF